jgi:tetratricopeptide (TPR) repeat protein
LTDTTLDHAQVLLKLFDHVRTKKPVGKSGHYGGLKGDLLLMLQMALRKEDADAVESVLWASWLAHPNPFVRSLLEDGVQLMQRAKYDEATARFQRLLELEPDFAEGYNKRGTSSFLAGRYDQSHADVMEALAREPCHFGSLIGKGLIENERGRKVHAIKAFRAALRVHPWSTSVGTTLHHVRRMLEVEEGGGVVEV